MTGVPGRSERDRIDPRPRRTGSAQRWPIVLLPGGILPAGPAYEALLAELGDDVDARAKDLEMYAGEPVPLAGYSLETEVDGIRRVADGAGFETFHLVGYSAGGASSLAFASRHPGRLRSLALMEPAWAGRTGQTPEEAAVFERFRAIPELSPDGIMPGVRPDPARPRR
jgi:pimeloyl-ACP methyl ester carboxylesterase